MTSWGYRINQWNAWRRFFLLLGLLIALGAAWYFFLEAPLLNSNMSTIVKQAQDKKIFGEVTALTQQQHNFIYANSLQPVQLRLTFQNAITGLAGLEITDFKDEPANIVLVGADQFSDAKKAMHLSLLPGIKQSAATITFSGGFDAFVNYLKVLQNGDQVINYESILFDMQRYPTAVVTMKVFALGE